MSLKDISLQKYIDSARQEFNSTKTTLSDIERDFQERMNGESIGNLIGSMFCTIIWIAVFNVIYWLFHNIDEIKRFITSSSQATVLSWCFGVAIVLLVIMFFDELMLFLHYEKFSAYTNMINQLNHRLNSAQTSLLSEKEKLFDSESKNWNIPISLASPIAEESLLLKKTVNSIDALKKGKIEIIKNILYFFLVAIFTTFSLWLLLEPGVEILYDGFDEDFSRKTLRIICIVCMVIVAIGEIILSVAVWNKTDCSVKNVTLLILFASPIMFVLLIIIAGILAVIVIFLGAIIIGLLEIAAVIAVAALAICCCCGG